MNTTQQLEILTQEKNQWIKNQIAADVFRKIHGYDVNNDYAWATNQLRSLSMKIYWLNIKLFTEELEKKEYVGF